MKADPDDDGRDLIQLAELRGRLWMKRASVLQAAQQMADLDLIGDPVLGGQFDQLIAESNRLLEICQAVERKHVQIAITRQARIAQAHARAREAQQEAARRRELQTKASAHRSTRSSYIEPVSRPHLDYAPRDSREARPSPYMTCSLAGAAPPWKRSDEMTWSALKPFSEMQYWPRRAKMAFTDQAPARAVNGRFTHKRNPQRIEQWIDRVLAYVDDRDRD